MWAYLLQWIQPSYGATDPSASCQFCQSQWLSERLWDQWSPPPEIHVLMPASVFATGSITQWPSKVNSIDLEHEEFIQFWGRGCNSATPNFVKLSLCVYWESDCKHAKWLGYLASCPAGIAESDLWGNGEMPEGRGQYSHIKSYVHKFDS